ncbi:serine hydrolase domain-containing protein [Thalassotalea maritima]|uniref:serine hydrolase domain-containing protein n=1 Tax=Thalassotalea maritima TaxID=3242416 RepID=UPI003527EC95
MNKPLTLLVSLVFMFNLLGCSSSNSISTQQKQKNQLENLIIQANNKVGFNSVVLISKGDEVLFEKAIGKVGKNSSDKLTTNYAFSPGSITKEFSVIALLQLKQMNKISFNQSIADYFPELPDWKHEITIEHLLTHSSGLPDVKYRANMTTIQALDDLKQLKTLKFSPGEKFDYGNNNTILRGLVVEKVTGVSFEDYLQENLFSVAGMSGTFAKSDFKHINRKIALGAIPLALKGVTAYTTAKDLLKLEQYLWS